jgi:hypothetical protein
MDWQKPDIPAKYRKLYEQGRAGKAKAAIRSHCLMCVGWEANEVELCTAPGCPLYTLRNLAAQAQTEGADREKRRKRAIASGQRPPKRASANGHGDGSEAQNPNPAESVRALPVLQASTASEAALGSEAGTA